jgi:hypothetical protein
VINRIIPTLATTNDGWGLCPFSSLLQRQDAHWVVYFRGKIPLRSCLLALYIFWHCIQSWLIESFRHSFASLVSLSLSIRNSIVWRGAKVAHVASLEDSLLEGKGSMSQLSETFRMPEDFDDGAAWNQMWNYILYSIVLCILMESFHNFQ